MASHKVTFNTLLMPLTSRKSSLLSLQPKEVASDDSRSPGGGGVLHPGKSTVKNIRHTVFTHAWAKGTRPRGRGAPLRGEGGEECDVCTFASEKELTHVCICTCAPVTTRSALCRCVCVCVCYTFRVLPAGRVRGLVVPAAGGKPGRSGGTGPPNCLETRPEPTLTSSLSIVTLIAWMGSGISRAPGPACLNGRQMVGSKKRMYEWFKGEKDLKRYWVRRVIEAISINNIGHS